jgi:pSer/pThr/pTyr-binding forkhead associated (FHA) protein
LLLLSRAEACANLAVVHVAINREKQSVVGEGTRVPQPEPSRKSPDVAIELIDPAKGRPIRVWRFSNEPVISIGRAADRHVEINELYVSRLHAEIHAVDGRWMLRSLGRNGVMVHGQVISEMSFDENLTFRLGASGPTLRFRGDGDVNDFVATIGYDVVQQEMFRLDAGELVREVQAVASAPYFDKLQQAAREMKKRRAGA